MHGVEIHIMRKAITIIFATVGLLLTGCSTTHHHATKWEYKEVSRLPDVNKMADEGWEVAGYAAYVDTGNYSHQRYLMKRPKQ